MKFKTRLFTFLGNICVLSGLLTLIARFVDRFQRSVSKSAGPWTLGVQVRSLRTLQILIYHGISNSPSPFLPTMPTKPFQNQMTYLAEHCRVFNLEEAAVRLKTNDLPNRAVALTFDDGYKDFFLYAFPILKNLGLPATCFLPTEVIGTGTVLWHDKVCWAISRTTKPFLKGFGSLTGYSLTDKQGKARVQEQVLRYLRSLEDQHRQREIDHLVEELEVPSVIEGKDLMLNWEEIKLMAGQGISFGSHTVTHPILSKVDEKVALREIRQSRKEIQNRTFKKVGTFAYPSGRAEDFTIRIRDLVEQEGFICAVTTISGSNSMHTDPYQLKRIGYWDSTVGSFGIRFETNRFLMA